jgi:AraC-like DNA-binding protein
MVVREAMPARIRSPRAHDFSAIMRMASLRAANLFTMEHPRLDVERTRTHIRQGDPEALVLVLNLAGRQRIDQERRSVVLRPGDLTLYHSSQPMRTFSDPTLEREAAVVVALPQHEASISYERVRPLLATRLPGDSGISRVVSAYLSSLATGDALTDELSHPHLAEITLDLIVLMLARCADVPDTLPPERSQRVRLMRIQQSILSSLGDASLTPASIAAAHHISLRSLQRLFRANGSGVAAWIRDRRLQRCRVDLADPTLAGVSIGSIARRAGFDDPTSFSRSFKNAFGVSPADYRATVRAEPASGGS